ncbi:MAG TPA: MFS transporter [Planctomycetaceae bacterium]|nr:MFS transporter [Planctomycetaceae bacterium]
MLSRGRETGILVALTLAAFPYVVASAFFAIALPKFEVLYSVDASAATWLLTGFLLVSAVTTPIAGRLGDQYGRVRVMTGTLALVTIGSVLSATAGTFEMLLIGRLLQGFTACSLALGLGIVRERFAPERVRYGIGVLSAIWGVGTALSYLIVGPIVNGLGYEWLSWMVTVLAVLAIITTIGIIGLAKHPESRGGSADFLGGALFLIAVGGLLLYISQGRTWHWFSGTELGLLAAVVVAFVLFWLWEKRAAAPMVDFDILKRRQIMAVNIIGFLSGLGVFESGLLIPQILELPRNIGWTFGYGVTEVGFTFLPMSIAIVLCGLLSGPLLRKISAKQLLAIAMFMQFICYFGLALLHNHVVLIAVWLVFGGAGFGFVVACFANLVFGAVDLKDSTAAAGINQLLRQGGGTLAQQITGAILAASAIDAAHRIPSEGGWQAAAYMAAGVYLIGFLLTPLVPKPRQDNETDSEDEHVLSNNGSGA